MLKPDHRRVPACFVPACFVPACFVPACFVFAVLALGVACALPTLAEPPAAPAVQPAIPAAQATPQILVLNHVVPSELIKALSWDKPAALPEGVTQVLPLPQQNALAVTATPAGLAKFKAAVKVLDVEPRQVQVKFALAYVSDADLQSAGIGHEPYASGLPVARFLQALTERKAVGMSTILATANNVKASMSLYYGPKTPLMFAFTPHVNSDHSVTLALDVTLPEGAGENEIQALRTVQNSDTMVIVKPPAAPNADKKCLLLFVTPTVK